MRHDPVAVHEARVLRQAPLPIEAALWQVLRDRRFRGLKFRRQAIVAGRPVAFLCAAQRLAILVDADRPGHGPDGVALIGRGLRVIALGDDDIARGPAFVLDRLAVVLDGQSEDQPGTG